MNRLLAGAFPWVHRLAAASAQRLTPAGRLLAMLALGAAVFGADPRETHAYRLAALLAGCFVVAFAGTRWARPRVTVRRELPTLVTVHEPAGYYLHVTNDSAATTYGLRIQDELGAAAPGRGDFRRGRDEAAADNWFDRRVGFLRWLERLKRARGAVLEPVIVPMLRPGATARVFVPLTALRRGRLEFVRVTVAGTERLGLLRALTRRPLAGVVIAAPRRHPVPPLAAMHDPRRSGQQRHARTAGSGEDFVGLRDYRPGDPERHLHWRSFAKRGIPVVKQFADRHRDRLTIIVDCFQPVPDEALFEALLSIAASLATAPRPADVDLEVLIAGETLASLLCGPDGNFGAAALAALACVPIASRDGWRGIQAHLGSRAAIEAPCLLVTSAWDEARARGLAMYGSRQPGLRTLLLLGEDEAAPGSTAIATLRPSMLPIQLAALGHAVDSKVA